MIRPLNIQYRYLICKSFVRGQGKLTIGRNVHIRKSSIFVAKGAQLTIADNVEMENVNIYVGNGSCHIDSWGILRPTDGRTITITIDHGNVKLSDHVKLSCKRIWVRFGGKLTIGQYTNINAESEIRCDDKIVIGAFNQISYNVRIWDTNTHSILPPEVRRQVAIDKYPYFGYESARPQTSPILIGNDCWIGENAAIFKGVQIGDRSIVGYGTFVANKVIPTDSRVLNRRELSIDRLK